MMLFSDQEAPTQSYQAPHECLHGVVSGAAQGDYSGEPRLPQRRDIKGTFCHFSLRSSQMENQEII